jgi:acyl carrier protein
VSAQPQERIRQVLAAQGGLSVDPVSLAEHDDLFAVGLSSHAGVKVMLALEDAFTIEFPDRMLKRTTFQSIAAIGAAIAELQGHEHPAAPGPA